MAVSLRSHEVSDLCLGKPALRWLPLTATVSDALTALKKCGDNNSCLYLSIWTCDHSSSEKLPGVDDCRCIGKVCMVDIICYLCSESNLVSPFSALRSPITVLLPRISGQHVRQVQPHSSLLHALDAILEGAQNLVVPIQNGFTRRSASKKLAQKLYNSLPMSHHNGREFCWLTQEDVVRFLLNHIGLFSPLPAASIKDLGLIRTDILMVDYLDPASSAVELIKEAHLQQTSVAVVSGDDPIPKLIGEISPLTLLCCDETVSPAIAALSAGDLMAYIDYGGPPENLVDMVKARLKEKKMEGMLDLLEEFASLSDDEFAGGDSPTGVAVPVRAADLKPCRSGSISSRGRRSEAIVCHSRSSLVAVMIQALAHRINYVWVIEDDYSLVGIVTFSDMLAVFRDYLRSSE